MIAYGIKINSDIDLPFILPDNGEITSAVTLSSLLPLTLKSSITCKNFLYHTHDRNVYLNSDCELDGSNINQPWCYEVQNVVRFYWVGGSRTIYYVLNKGVDSSLLGFWFFHLLLPLYLTLENIYDFLHAGGVEVDGKSMLFLAPSMGGKSTLTDYFIQQGHSLISDDKVPLYIQEKKLMAVGSYPYHRPYRKFEDLGNYVEEFSVNPIRIHLFYELESVDKYDKVSIEEIKGFKKIDTLLPQYLYMFPYLRRERFKYLSKILNEMHVFKVKVPLNMHRLEEVYMTICNHSRAIK